MASQSSIAMSVSMITGVRAAALAEYPQGKRYQKPEFVTNASCPHSFFEREVVEDTLGFGEMEIPLRATRQLNGK